MAQENVAGSSRNPLAPFNNYLRQLCRYKEPLPCSFCGERIPPRDYEKHCENHHDLNTKESCVWCQGVVSWPKGEKKAHGPHLFRCWLTFKSQLSERSESAEECFCPARDLFGRSLEDRYLSIPQPLVINTSHMTFKHSSLNKAAHTLRLFQSEKNWEWFHAMVSKPAYDSFVEALDGGPARVSEFSTWCDGGSAGPHRHMIVASPKEHSFYDRVWKKKVRLPTRSEDETSFNCKRIKPIKTLLHLANTIGYLSKRESRCRFNGEDPPEQRSQRESRRPSSGEGRPEQRCHYYITTALPVNYLYALVGLWKEGHKQLVEQKYRNLSVRELFYAPGLKRTSRRWRIPYGMIPNAPRDIGVSVTAHRPGLYYYLGSRKIKLPKGKCRTFRYFEDLKEEFFYPKPSVQARLNDMNIPQTSYRELKAEFEEYKEKHAGCEEFRVQNERLMAKSERQTARYRANEKEWMTEIRRLRTYCYRSDAEKERLKAENEELKAECSGAVAPSAGEFCLK